MSENRILYAALSDSGSEGKYLILQRVVLAPDRSISEAEIAVAERWPTAKFESWYVNHRDCYNGLNDVKLEKREK